METLPAAPSEPEPAKEEAPAPLPPAPRFALNPYLTHQQNLAVEAFAVAHPDLAEDLSEPSKKDAVMLWWVGKGYAAAFSHAAKTLRDTGEDRLPNLGDLELDSEEEEPGTMELAEKRFGQRLR